MYPDKTRQYYMNLLTGIGMWVIILTFKTRKEYKLEV